MTVLDPISERQVRLTIARADRNGRRRSVGKVLFSYDGTNVVARRRQEIMAEGVVTEIKPTGTERWRVVLENGDVWDAHVGCGCGGH